MSSPFQLHLLRRTLAAWVALSGLGFAGAVHAQGTVTLSGASGNNCAYSAMSITPNGNVNVTCSGTQQPPPTGETFAMNIASASAAVGAIVNWDVVRAGPSGHTFGAAAVNFTYSGSGCALSGTFPVAFAAGQMSSPISAPMAGNGICTATLIAPPAPAGLASPTSTVITVGTGGPVNPPVNPGVNCPSGFVPPENLVNAQLGGEGNLLQQALKSGQVVAIPLPKIGGIWSSGTVTFSENASSPQPVTIEISVNKCPGLMESDDGQNACNLRTQFGHNNKIQWLSRPFGGFNGATPPRNLKPYELCWAGDDSTQYYVNARWSFPACGFGLTACGYAIQWNPGPY